ncbi:hypothetical protein PTSG_09434 [Salpingoeca rosetta]|uniref:PNPLA domain-containing protein n=1 Tax=Salpingoeca rosetta (strain ATCC 50818 / BSB-021) TaxID=946362 RepID=F2UML8_SALR5|nr:uncharacterized protein PTSG_09434 [Salpingoeca rosetta]EGD78367.1 hypothetical protein PTSG_09434 [Salpingoeca rosetta]|eukprot:XP_004989690.1 hypothetical protein PTSG_09434 [Salpingoeca rosetta]
METEGGDAVGSSSPSRSPKSATLSNVWKGFKATFGSSNHNHDRHVDGVDGTIKHLADTTTNHDRQPRPMLDDSSVSSIRSSPIPNDHSHAPTSDESEDDDVRGISNDKDDDDDDDDDDNADNKNADGVNGVAEDEDDDEGKEEASVSTSGNGVGAADKTATARLSLRSSSTGVVGRERIRSPLAQQDGVLDHQDSGIANDPHATARDKNSRRRAAAGSRRFNRNLHFPGTQHDEAPATSAEPDAGARTASWWRRYWQQGAWWARDSLLHLKTALLMAVWTVVHVLRAVLVRFAWVTTGSLSGTRSIVTGVVELFADVCDVANQIAAHWLTRGLGPSQRSSLKATLRYQLKHARTYDEWKDTAIQLDKLVGNVTWKMGFESTLYDYMLLRDHLDAFYQARMKDDRARMAWLLRTTLHRNLANMGNPKLFERCYHGTKDLIEQYVSEVVYQINYLADTNIPGLSHEDKLQMFEAMRSSFGRSALLLSGGGGFGIYHLGVVRVLHKEGLLPRILSGSSAGSLMASLICTRTDEELDEFFENEIPDVKNWNLLVPDGEDVDFASLLRRLFRTGSMADVRVLEKCIYDNIGDITFEEAYKRTGRVLNITINARDSSESPRLLNHLTAPNVVIASAACASCALMGLFDTVEIKAEFGHGRRVAWNPGGQVWSDGSMETDLPMEQLAEHFNVNHFIVSQVNPHILPFLRYRSFWNSRLLQLVRSEMLYRLEQLLKLGFKPHWIKNFSHLLSQPYSGDITVTPRVTLNDYLYLVSNPTPERVRHGVLVGQLATWPKLSILQSHCQIEMALDNAVHRLGGGEPHC